MNSTITRKIAFTAPFTVLLTLLLAASAGPAAAVGDPAAGLERRDGRLAVIWGDPRPGSEQASHQVFHLVEDSGRSVELEISPALRRLHGGVLSWNGRHVEVTVEAAAAAGGGPLAVRSVRFLDGGDADKGGGVFGSQPWVSILCKFQNIGTEPENLAFFQSMYANQPGGLDHYWREVSYDNIDVAGSLAVNWVVLPHPQTFYIPTPGSGSGANLSQLFNDCTAAADPFVDFSNGGEPFVGINMMFNGLLDCCAWGGSRFATLDGISKSWRTTWEPPWGYADEGVIGHEMGHGFGLPHANNFDGDSTPYDTPWDVMSAATSYGVNDPTYGRLGKHVLAYHKGVILGWVAPAEIFEVPGPGSYTVTLDHMALATTSNHRFVRIPVPASSRYYTVEARKRIGNYDGNLPGDCVIISEVVPGRQEPAWTVDGAVPPASFADNEGTMWRVGETFVDTAAMITVTVEAATANGFVVNVTSGGSPIFANGFEAGSTSSWSSAVP